MKKPTDLDLHCSERQGISRTSRTRVNNGHNIVSLYQVVFFFACCLFFVVVFFFGVFFFFFFQTKNA